MLKKINKQNRKAHTTTLLGMVQPVGAVALGQWTLASGKTNACIKVEISQLGPFAKTLFKLNGPGLLENSLPGYLPI